MEKSIFPEALKHQQTNNSHVSINLHTQSQRFPFENPSKVEFIKAQIGGFDKQKLFRSYPGTSVCSTYMHREGESKHVPPFSQGLYLSTQRNPVENREIC